MSLRPLVLILASSAVLGEPQVSVGAQPRSTCSFIPSPDSPPLFTVPWLKWVIRGAVSIVRVRVIDLWPGVVSSHRAIDDDPIQAVVLETLVGTGVPDTLRLYGRVHGRDVYPSDTIPYLHAGYSTMCYRADFRRGGEHLLLLWRREDSTWTAFGPAFAPSMVQVRGSDDPWVQWVMGVRTGRIP